MKTSRIEPLESRIAPATFAIAPGGKSATFTDVDGDLVRVAIDRGDLNNAGVTLRDVGGGRAQLEILDLRGVTTFSGTSITFTATRQGPAGDGNVNVGYLNATDLDLGTVRIPGDLGAIDAGDAVAKTPAVKSLALQSLGVFGLTTGAPDLESDLDGRVGAVTIRGDVREASLFVFDRNSDTGGRGGGTSGDGEAFIGSLTIGGNLIGGAGDFSGSILVRDGLLKATVGGSIVGGAGRSSGGIGSIDSLGAITIRGSIIGGLGIGSGRIGAATDGAESVTILGSILGGAGQSSGLVELEQASGSFFLGGSLLGGSGQRAGEIDIDGPIRKVTIMGDVLGGAGQSSARIQLEDPSGTFFLGGAVVAGTGDLSALLRFDDDLASLTILGSIIGHASSSGAQVVVEENLGKLELGGSIIGGGAGSGMLDVGKLKNGTIRGNVVGGPGSGSGQLRADAIGTLATRSFLGGDGAESGSLRATGNLGTLKVLGSLIGGSGDRSGQFLGSGAAAASLAISGSLLSGTGATSGSILFDGALGTVRIGGEIRGTADDPVTISGGGRVVSGGSPAIGLANLQVTGGVTHARLLAGYEAGGLARNADAAIGNVTVGGDWIASSLAAGVVAGADNLFGTADDAVISGAGTVDSASLASRIGSVTIRGQALGTPAAGGGFGLVAEQLGSLRVGPVSWVLTTAADAIALGATGDFFAREPGASNPVSIPGSAAALVDDATVTFSDVDGDLVTVRVSRGTLDLTENFVFAGSGSGQQLQRLVLTDPEFAGASVIISARRSASGGDGSVNVGYLDATGNDLGSVTIAGDLGALDAGDATPATRSVRSLAVQSLGLFGLTTGAPDLESDLDGRVGSIAIRGDLVAAIIDVFDRTKDTGNQGSGSSGAGEAFIEALTIGGSIVGGATQNAGSILLRDGLLRATIGGNLLGGAGPASGMISSFDSLGDLTIRGSIIGGSANAAGKVSSTTQGIESLTILGSLLGGVGANTGVIDIGDFDRERPTGSFLLGGSVVGGAGATGGQIDFAGPVRKATILGDIQGGAGQFSGRVIFEETGGTFLLGGSVVAGSANFSAQLDFEEGLGGLTIRGAIVGRNGTFSAQVEVNDDLGSLALGGSVLGGGEGSGRLDMGTLRNGTIRGSVVGGAGSASGQLDASGIGTLTVGSLIGGVGSDSGRLENFARDVGRLKVQGSLVGGAGDRSGQLSIPAARLASLEIAGSLLSGPGATSGSVLSGGALGQVRIGGGVLGTPADPVTISGGGDVPSGTSSAIGIGSLSIAGGVSHARILAGYDASGAARNADAVLGKVSVGGDWLASSLAAGIAAGADAAFGTVDDALISGSGTRNDASLSSRIASILIKGQLLGTAGGTDAFGFVAQQIGSLKVGAISYPFTAAPSEILGLGATGDFSAREDV